jgi:hypothetical protein
MRVGAFLILSCVLLCSCVSREEVAARREIAQANREQQCVSFGYKKGSPDYSKCLQSLYLQDQQLAAAEEENSRARLQTAARGLQQAGAALQSISPPPSMIHCDTMPNAMGTSTTCY